MDEEKVLAGQAVYSKRVLKAYDFLVLGVSNRLIWRCPTRRLLKHYNDNVTSNHLDVGVGSGYFMDKCRFPTPNPRVALMDLNQNTLDFASTRIARYGPQTYRRNVLEPISMEGGKFDSIGVNYLIHCLPGSIESKAVIFDHLSQHLNPAGTLFGSTLLQGGVTRNWAARRLMHAYNKKGIFSNRDDTLDALCTALSQRFEEISMDVIGCAALFSCRVK